VARHLDGWGFPVQVVWFTREAELRGDAKTQWDILQHSTVDQTAWYDARGESLQADALDALFASADWLVDGLLGTGLTRPLEGALGLVVEAMNRSGKPILALDLPSGLDADRGTPLGTAIRARATATFVAPKLGFSAEGASDYTGEVVVIDIGIPRCLLRPFEE
jgi:NAD(P)H-hydrate epimerase